MRVLLVTHRYPPDYLAGVENYTLALAEALRAHDVVTVATTKKVISRPIGTIVREERRGVAVYEVVNHHGLDRFEETYDHPAMERAFTRILDEVKPDVLHIQHFMYWSLGIARIAHARKIPVVLTLHDYWALCGRMGQLIDYRGARCDGPDPARCAPCLSQTTWTQPENAKKWIRRLTAVRRLTGLALDDVFRALGGVLKKKAAAPPTPEAVPGTPEWLAAFERRRSAFRDIAVAIDRIIAPSATVARLHAEFGWPAAKITLTPHGIDKDVFLAARRAAPARTHGPLRLAFVGQIAPHKGVHVILEAVRRLPADRVTLDVVGSDAHAKDYGARLRTEAADSPNIRFLGPKARAEVAAFLPTVDCILVPSLWNEGAPLTIQEAFVAGVPALVSDLGGMADMVRPGEGGDRVPAGDVSAWAAAIGRVMDDPAVLERCVARIPEVPSVAENARRIRDIYVELGADRPRSRVTKK